MTKKSNRKAACKAQPQLPLRTAADTPAQPPQPPQPPTALGDEDDEEVDPSLIITTLEVITPAIAEFYLTFNEPNRKLSPEIVNWLAKVMATPEWQINGDTITFARTGRLLDGQHRLSAIIKYGKPKHILVCRGVSEKAFKTKDIGKRRTAADTLSIRGEKNCTQLAAAIIFVHRYFTGRLGMDKGSYSPTHIEALLDDYGDPIRQSVHFANNLKHKQLLPGKTVAGLHYIFSKIDSELADRFWSSVIHGTNLTADSPMFVVRERIMRNKIDKSKLDADTVAALIVNAWNHERAGTTVRYMRVPDIGPNGTGFPVAV